MTTLDIFLDIFWPSTNDYRIGMKQTLKKYENTEDNYD